MEVNNFITNYCPGCMRAGSEQVCPECGFDRAVKNEAPALSCGHLLEGRYVIGRTLSSDSEGFTYIAKDQLDGKRVCIREFFPEELVERANDGTKILEGCKNAHYTCAAEFVYLWKGLMSLNGLSALPKVNRVFFAEGSLVAIYDYEDSISLREYIDKTQDGLISYEESRRLLLSVLTTLETLHTKDIYHRGISFDNIRVREDKSVFITGFGIPQSRKLMCDISADLPAGFSAPEQYKAEQFTGAWTDVYACAVLIFYTLTGTVVPDAKLRMTDDTFLLPLSLREKLPKYVSVALVDALAVSPSERTDSMESFRLSLFGLYEKPQDYVSAYYRAENKKRQAIATSQLLDLEKTVPAKVTVNTEKAAIIKPQKLNSTTSTRLSQTHSAPFLEKTTNEKKESENKTPPIHVSPGASVNNPAPTPKTSTPPKSKKKKKKKKDNGVGKFTVMIVLLCVVLCVGLYYLLGDTSDSLDAVNATPQTDVQSVTPVTSPTADAETVDVPGFVGELKTHVMADAEARNILNISYEDEYSRDVEPGIIIRQSIEAGTQTAKMSQLVLYVSAGPKPYTMINFVGTDANAAKELLESNGITVVTQTFDNDGSQIANTVSTQSVAEGVTVYDGDTVTLIIWGEKMTEAPTTETPTTSSHGQDEGIIQKIVREIFG